MLLDISKTIEPAIAAVVADLAGLADRSNIQFMVVGAAARDMVLDCGFGITVGRATRDIDFGVRVADWNEFERLVRLLKTNHWHCPEQQQHRFVHNNGIPVDLIPFGAIESDDGEIRWPPHDNEALSVIGFADAYADSWEVQIQHAPTLAIQVASPTGQALLKLVAWRDRGLIRGGRDATDLRLLMEHYQDLDNVERVAEEHPEWMDDQFDYALVGAKLLGADVFQCIESTQSGVFVELINTLRPTKVERGLAFSMHRVGNNPDLLHCQQLVDVFCDALGIGDGGNYPRLPGPAC